MAKYILYLTVRQSHYAAKYQSQVLAWQELGYNCQQIDLQSSADISSSLHQQIAQADLVYIRQELALIKLWRKLRPHIVNKPYIVEIPTPLHIYFQEIKNSTQIANWKKNIFFIWLIKRQIADILSLSKMIIEFAEELSPLVLKYKKRIYLWQNGVNLPKLYGTSSYQLFNHATIDNFCQHKQLNLIMVANLADYHGLDRLILGLAKYYQTKTPEIAVRVTIVAGENAALNSNKQLVNQLALNKHISFAGYNASSELFQLYQVTNIAIGPIASYRKNLFQASSLKLREYALFGLPSIIDHHDYDLSSKDYILQIPSDNAPVDVNQLINFYQHLIKTYNHELPNIISDYAQNNLLWTHKVKQLELILKQNNLI